jgi:molybdopterin converting factor small subunit
MNGRVWSKVLLSVILLALTIPNALAQKVKDTGPKYDVANEVKVKGVIDEVRDVPGHVEATALMVKTDTGNVLVRVAPTTFLKEMDTSFKKGDEVQVVGAKAPDATEPEILAREITVGTNTVTLRDDKGIPVWVGWSPSTAAK